MPEICVYLGVGNALHAPFKEFAIRAHAECGIDIPEPTLPLHVTVKMKTPVSSGLAHVMERTLSDFVSTYAVKRIVASVLPPFEFTIDKSCAKVLYLPIEAMGMALYQIIDDIILDLEEKFGLRRAGFEGDRPHVTLVEQVPCEQQEPLLKLARSMPWVPTVTLDSIVVARKEDGTWVPGAPIPLLAH